MCSSSISKARIIQVLRCSDRYLIYDAAFGLSSRFPILENRNSLYDNITTLVRYLRLLLSCERTQWNNYRAPIWTVLKLLRQHCYQMGKGRENLSVETVEYFTVEFLYEKNENLQRKNNVEGRRSRNYRFRERAGDMPRQQKQCVFLYTKSITINNSYTHPRYRLPLIATIQLQQIHIRKVNAMYHIFWFKSIIQCLL